MVQQAGLMLMTLAVTLGMAELPHHTEKRVVMPSQPVFEAVAAGGGDNTPNSLRREREETGPHYVSYSVTQRTPGRTGRV